MKNKSRFGLTTLILPFALPALMAGFANPAAADDEPTIDKDSIRLTLQHGSERAYEKPGWVPYIEYRVNAELACGGDAISNEKAVVYSGPVGFTIRLRNELSGTNATLFTGKTKVVKVPGTSGANASDDYYVDEDWRIPMGYVFFESDSGHGGDAFLHVGFWFRGNPPDIEAHLFYQGKDIAKFTQAGNGARDWNPAKYLWGFADCEFLGVYLNQPAEGEGYDPRFGLAKNPGEYEVKALVVGHLARSIKFTVGPDGKFDNGIATANKLGSDRVIVPVQVIGNQGPWDKAAWKTGAFYGNPLTGFTAVQ